MEAVKARNKGIFMCILRGKISEQLQFTGNFAKVCLVIGIPYLLVNDPRVNLKKAYLDRENGMRGDSDEVQITGDYWYKSTALREVNLICGKCIKH